MDSHPNSPLEVCLLGQKAQKSCKTCHQGGEEPSCSTECTGEQGEASRKRKARCRDQGPTSQRETHGGTAIDQGHGDPEAVSRPSPSPVLGYYQTLLLPYHEAPFSVPVVYTLGFGLSVALLPGSSPGFPWRSGALVSASSLFFLCWPIPAPLSTP